MADLKSGLTDVNNFQIKDWHMTEIELNDDAVDAVAVVERACVDIETVRKNLQRLYERLASANDTAKEIARNELCRALVQRLELAEREAVELGEMIAAATGKTS
jgi:hypothetical protein